MTFADFDSAPVFAISVVAQITGMHPQTLRQYDRVGLVTPQRTSGSWALSNPIPLKIEPLQDPRLTTHVVLLRVVDRRDGERSLSTAL